MTTHCTMKTSINASSIIRHPSSGCCRGKVQRRRVFTRLAWLALLTTSLVGASSRASTTNYMVINTNPVQPFILNGPVGTATAQTSTHFHDNIARVGVNYRFW